MGVPFAGTLPAPRAINSSKTRDCKVKMLQTMTEQEIDSFEDYLADVLCVWDCYEQEWVEKAPVILRFEKMDVLIQRPSIGGDAKLSVPTAGSEIGYPESRFLRLLAEGRSLLVPNWPQIQGKGNA